MAELQRGLKYILDTNVVFGAMKASLAPENAEISDHMCLKALMTIRANKGKIYLSHQTRQELIHVTGTQTTRDNLLPDTTERERATFIRAFLASSTSGQTKPCTVPCADPEDQMFFHLAQGVDADFLLSRDRKVLDMDGQVSVRCWPPEVFLAQHGVIAGYNPPEITPPPTAEHIARDIFGQNPASLKTQSPAQIADALFDRLKTTQGTREKPATRVAGTFNRRGFSYTAQPSQRKGVPAPAA